MSQTLSPSFPRSYGLARVARVWTVSRASVYRSLKATPAETIARRPPPERQAACQGLPRRPSSAPVTSSGWISLRQFM